MNFMKDLKKLLNPKQKLNKILKLNKKLAKFYFKL